MTSEPRRIRASSACPAIMTLTKMRHGHLKPTWPIPLGKHEATEINNENQQQCRGNLEGRREETGQKWHESSQLVTEAIWHSFYIYSWGHSKTTHFGSGFQGVWFASESIALDVKGMSEYFWVNLLSGLSKKRGDSVWEGPKIWPNPYIRPKKAQKAPINSFWWVKNDSGWIFFK